VTSNSPCSSTPNATSQPVSVNLLPEKIPSVLVNISPDGAVCEGTSVSFTAVPTNGGTTPTYTWKVNGVPVSGVNGPSFGSSSLKNGDKVSVDMLSSEACPGPNPVAVSTDVTMSILPKVIPSVSIVSSPGNDICSGTSVTFTATPVNGGTAPGLQWFINGNPAAGANSTTFTSSTLNNGDLITLRVQSNAQCPDPASVISDPIEMKVDPTTSGTVTIASAQNLPVCEGTALNFTATGNNLGPTPVYTWLINGNTSGTNSSTFSIPAPVNSDVVQLRVQPDGRCFSSNEVLSNQITLQILPNQAPSVSITATPSDTVCKNSYTIQFTAIPVNGGTTPSYSWKLNNVSDGSDASTYTNAFFKAGDIVEVEMTSNYQCKTNPTAKSNKIEIKGHTPILADAGIEQVICRDQTVTLNASATGGKNGPKDYRWTPGNLSGNPVTVTPEVSTTYLVEVSDQCGSFLAYDSVRVVVNPKPSADFNWNPFEPILMLTPEVRFNNPNVIPVTRQWDFGDGSTSTDANPIHIFEKRGLYSVTLYVTSEQGCKDSKTALLNVKDIFVFYIPNSFTPNGDGLNDRFTFYFNDSIPFTIDVFNRWGQLVYSGNEKSEFWDGRDPLTGDYVQDDVYIYRLVYRRKGLDGEQPRITLNGHVTVLKNIED
jgi:gliding motility-associated-like protein